MKVRELLRALAGVSPEVELVMRCTVERNGTDTPYVGGVDAASLQRDHRGEPYFAIDSSTSDSPATPAPVLRLVRAEELFAGVVPPMRIVHVVAHAYSVAPEMLLDGPKTQALCEARFIVWWLLRAHTRLSLPAIGRMFKRDHTTILAGVKKCEARRAANATWRAQVATLQDVVTAP